MPTLRQSHVAIERKKKIMAYLKDVKDPVNVVAVYYNGRETKKKGKDGRPLMAFPVFMIHPEDPNFQTKMFLAYREDAPNKPDGIEQYQSQKDELVAAAGDNVTEVKNINGEVVGTAYAVKTPLRFMGDRHVPDYGGGGTKFEASDYALTENTINEAYEKRNELYEAYFAEKEAAEAEKPAKDPKRVEAGKKAAATRAAKAVAAKAAAEAEVNEAEVDEPELG